MLASLFKATKTPTNLIIQNIPKTSKTPQHPVMHICELQHPVLMQIHTAACKQPSKERVKTKEHSQSNSNNPSGSFCMLKVL